MHGEIHSALRIEQHANVNVKFRCCSFKLHFVFALTAKCYIYSNILGIFPITSVRKYFVISADKNRNVILEKSSWNLSITFRSRKLTRVQFEKTVSHSDTRGMVFYS